MTTTTSANDGLVVVDGSNIATEGRSVPSLVQLNEAVLSFREEYPGVNVTVVVDATFGHRIDKSEVAEFDEAVAHNELVAPPAGAVGRGDAFVLSIAHKSGARILSNDSFQEFHGAYPWLFDEGRLIGGKPVPHVGWVFVNRVPVKGPVSRKSRAAAAEQVPPRRSGSKLASQPMPAPTAPPPRAKPTKTARKQQPAEIPSAVEPTKAVAARGGPVNELLPFLEFVEHHPVGSSVTGVVDSYSSHGAYITLGNLRGYVPLRLMGNPPPRSAREVMRQGEPITLVVENFAPARRSVDLALPGVATALPPPAPIDVPPALDKARSAKRSPRKAAEPQLPVDEPKPKRAAKSTAGPPSDATPAKKAPAATNKAATPRPPTKKAAKKAATPTRPKKASEGKKSA